jgi:hypothetical protein
VSLEGRLVEKLLYALGPTRPIRSTRILQPPTHIWNTTMLIGGPPSATCYLDMSTQGFVNYLGFRFSGNPQCPSMFRAAVDRVRVSTVCVGHATSDAPWDVDAADYHLGPDGSWLCHQCHVVFGGAPPGRGHWRW